MIVLGAGNMKGTVYLVGESQPTATVPVDRKGFDYAVELVGLTVVGLTQFPGGKKIPIIKMVRERFGLDLKGAKEAVEAALSHLVNQDHITL